MSDNPLMSKLKKKNPGQVFRMPSRGLLYKNDELSSDVQDGEVLVQPMSTLDEIYMRTPDMLYQGTAVEKVFSRCIPQINDSKKLLAKDVDYLLSCLRKVTYGEHLPISYRHDCNNAKEHEYMTSISSFFSKSRELDSKILEDIEFEYDNFYFKIKFLTYEEMIELNRKISSSGDNPEDIYNNFIENLSTHIISIDNVENKEHIKELIDQSDREFQTKIAEKINNLNGWGIDFLHNTKCKDCGEDIEIPITINPITFFTQPSEVETKQE